MGSEADLIWMSNRLGYGLTSNEFSVLQNEDLSEFMGKRIDPSKYGLEVPSGPFENIEDLIPTDRDSDDFQRLRRIASLKLLDLWLDEMRLTSDPLLEWMTFFWHDHFAVSGRVVKSMTAHVNHLRLLRTHARGNYSTMLREVTTDPGMLIFLDGASNTAEKPNENFGRELLELYSLGIGNYSESDVQAASTALTGWRISDGMAKFRPRLHDDTPQTLLGVKGVHDVDTVIEAVINHEALPGFISRKLSNAVLGNDISDEIVNEFASVFSNNDLQIIPLIEAIVDKGLSMGKRTQIIRNPVSWLINAEKITDVELGAERRARALSEMNMIPGRPPNVGGFPETENYLSASSTAARFSAAITIASDTSKDSPALQAASSANWDDLAHYFGYPDGFNQPTVTSLQELWNTSPMHQRGRICLAIALASPDFMVI
ncbi:MAG TPA: DUF1800 family protein [Acidimicrobiales bacterium]|nr:DUF1800 family protein [Acidimicrobiales bacterium]